MKLILSVLLTFFVSFSFGQTRIDTLDEGGWPKKDAAYILGKENGFKEYRARRAFLSGLIFPMVTGIGIRSSHLGYEYRNVGLGFVGVWGIAISLDQATKIPIETKNSNIQYIKGYKSAVRTKRLGNGLVGGVVGFLIMNLIFVVFPGA